MPRRGGVGNQFIPGTWRALARQHAPSLTRPFERIASRPYEEEKKKTCYAWLTKWKTKKPYCRAPSVV